MERPQEKGEGSGCGPGFVVNAKLQLPRALGTTGTIHLGAKPPPWCAWDQM